MNREIEQNRGLFDLALKEGKLVHIDDVANGLACGCICPQCEGPLVAYNNDKNHKAHHFHHKNLTSCTGSFETALHYLAKEIILETKTLTVPRVAYSLSNQAGSYSGNLQESFVLRRANQVLSFDTVEVEKSQGKFRPDLRCRIGNKILLIEIAVTHFIDDAKRLMINNAGLALLEIDLSSYSRDIQREKLKEILQGATENMKWIYNKRVSSDRSGFLKQANIIKDFVLKNTKDHKVYGKNNDVYDCPLYKHLGKISTDDACYHCRYSAKESEALTIGAGETKPKFPQYSHQCVGHKAKEFDTLLTSLRVKF